MSELRVEVTQTDIDRGRRNATGCPLARAIRRATTVRPVAVFGHGHGWDNGDTTYALGRDVDSFIAAFDAGMPVTPRVFLIEGPPA